MAYSKIDIKLNQIHRKLEAVSCLFGVVWAILLCFFYNRIVYVNYLIDLFFILLFIILIIKSKYLYLKDINRFFYARFGDRSFIITFASHLLVLFLYFFIFLALILGQDFLMRLGIVLNQNTIYGRFSLFLISGSFLSTVIAKSLILYLIMFIIDAFIVVIVFIRVVIGGKREIFKIMSYSNTYNSY
ncbi:hypothetical protein BMT54_11745 [Pasteurellaceae bacterium 15-036681]|nr:hypothetical protein BMT54_11745 [Pasteurellaceae bacterium 15-036681]